MIRKRAGFLLLALIPALLLAGQDRSKKAYELIYEDVQALKKQIASLEEKFGRSAEAIEGLKSQLRDVQALIRLLQSDQAAVQEGVRNIPTQYQYVLDKLDQMNLVLTRMAEDLLTLKGAPAQPTAGPEAKEPPAAEKKGGEGKKSSPPEQKAAPPSPPATTLSPQEVYNAAYSDYLKGNFDLAVEGFEVYRATFPDSPLADNALYWIGECLYSQKKFDPAIEEFNDLIFNYPQSDKIAASYLKKGLAQSELGRKEEAIMTLKLLMGKYPLEEESRIAQEKIKELGSK
jgi:tol-pal system protein YbgF